VSVGERDGEVEGVAFGDDDGERAGVGDAEGLADGVDVGPSAIAGVPRKDTLKMTARSGGARKRCICKPSKRVPYDPQRADTRLLSERARPF